MYTSRINARIWSYSNQTQTYPVSIHSQENKREKRTFQASIFNNDEFAVFSRFVKTPIAIINNINIPNLNP